MDAVYYLSGFLLTIVTLGLVVSTILFLVKPHLLNNRKVVKKPFSRGKILLVGVLAIFASFISFGSVLAATEPASVKEARAAAEAAQKKATPAPASNKKAEPKAPEPITKTEEKTEVIPFETVTKQSSSLPKGQESVTAEGVNGEKVLSYEVTYLDGKEINRVFKAEVVKKEPVSKVVTIGTYVAPAPKPKPKTSTNAKPKSSCNPNYSGCVPNVSYDLNCPDIKQKVRVLGYDEYRLDNDKDGWGCDSYE